MNNYLFTGSNKFYTFEGLLSSWIQTGITLLTTAMLFYHITRVKSIKTHKRLAVFITITLLLVSIVYLIVSLVNYLPRARQAIKLCKQEKQCPDSAARDLQKTTVVYGIMVLITIIITLLIGFLVYNTI